MGQVASVFDNYFAQFSKPAGSEFGKEWELLTRPSRKQTVFPNPKLLSRHLVTELGGIGGFDSVHLYQNMSLARRAWRFAPVARPWVCVSDGL